MATLRSPSRTVTQKQIADELGVSRQLVSLALNGGGRISTENRRRVREVAERLGYDANSNHEARAMIARRYARRASSGLIGCAYLSTSHSSGAPIPYETHLLNGIRQAAQQHGREVLLLHPTPSPGWERVDGLLVHGNKAIEFQDRLGARIPTVAMMSEIAGFDNVIAADREGAHEATEYLLRLGHKRIAYLLYTQGTPLMQQRLQGYREALRAHGIAPRKTWIGELINCGPMLERGYHSMQSWLRNGWAKLGCTALLVQNDRAAVGAMTALREAGIRVPQDLSVIGFDSTDECELTVPRLTSVQVPLEEIGSRAANLLFQQIEHNTSRKSQTIVLPTRLQIRDSTAPPATTS